MSEKPPRFRTIDQLEASARCRRIFERIGKIATITGLSLGMLLATDQALGTHTPTETMLVTEGPTYYAKDSASEVVANESAKSIESFVLPGFDGDSHYIDRLVGSILDKYGPREKVVYGDNLSIPNLTETIADTITAGPDHRGTQENTKDQPLLVFYGHSIGGDTSIRVIARLIEKYHIDPSRFLLILDCSPASNADVNTDFHQWFVSFLDAVSYTPFRGGPISRFTAETINAMTDGADPISAIERGWKNRDPEPQEMSNAVVVAQAHILKDQTELIHAANVLKKNSVPVAFMAPGNTIGGTEEVRYHNDGIVHDASAYADWKSLFGSNLSNYLITGHNLHGIQVRNQPAYTSRVDAFLTSQGVDPYQPDIIDSGDESGTIDAKEQSTSTDSALTKQSVLDPSDSYHYLSNGGGGSANPPASR